MDQEHRGAGDRGGSGGWQLLERFDRSANGRLSQADVAAVRGEHFAAFDQNGDGTLSSPSTKSCG